MPMAAFHWLAMGARCGYSASRSPATTSGSGERQYRIALLMQSLGGCWPVDGSCTLRPVVVLQTGLVRLRDSAHATFSACGCADSGADSRVNSARLRSTPHR